MQYVREFTTTKLHLFILHTTVIHRGILMSSPTNILVTTVSILVKPAMRFNTYVKRYLVQTCGHVTPLFVHTILYRLNKPINYERI